MVNRAVDTEFVELYIVVLTTALLNERHVLLMLLYFIMYPFLLVSQRHTVVFETSFNKCPAVVVLALIHSSGLESYWIFGGRVQFTCDGQR